MCEPCDGLALRPGFFSTCDSIMLRLGSNNNGIEVWIIRWMDDFVIVVLKDTVHNFEVIIIIIINETIQSKIKLKKANFHKQCLFQIFRTKSKTFDLKLMTNNVELQ